MKDDRDEMANEAADLLYHMLVLLADADMSLGDAVAVLKKAPWLTRCPNNLSQAVVNGVRAEEISAAAPTVSSLRGSFA